MATGLLLCVALIVSIAVVDSKSHKEDASGIGGRPSGRPEQDGSDEEPENHIRVGNKIEYDTIATCVCAFVIAEVDVFENIVHGFFEVTLPLGAVPIDPPEYDLGGDNRDEDYLWITYRLEEALYELRFDVSDTLEEFEGWTVCGDYAVVKADPGTNKQ